MEYVEGSINHDAQVYFENHCDVGNAIPSNWIEKHPLKDCILDTVGISLASAFCQGVYYGWSHPQEVDVENLPQEVKNINYLFAFNFHDNDFGDYFLVGAKDFCSRLNNMFIAIGNSNKDEMDYTTNELKDNINDFISLDNLINYIVKGIYVFSLRDTNIDVPTENIFKECEDIIESFGVKNKKEDYLFGNIKDVSEKIISDNIGFQMEPKPIELKDMWLNGEYLFVKIENGFANAWIQ